MVSKHPWEILPELVLAEILSKEDARGLVLAHEDANRRSLLEIHAAIPELLARGWIEPDGADHLRRIVIKASRESMPDA